VTDQVDEKPAALKGHGFIRAVSQIKSTWLYSLRKNSGFGPSGEAVTFLIFRQNRD